MDFTKTILEGIKYWVDKKFVNIEKELVGKQPAGDYVLKEEIPVDWNQNDSTQLNYVKNRTHYYEGETTTEIYSTTFMSSGVTNYNFTGWISDALCVHTADSGVYTVTNVSNFMGSGVFNAPLYKWNGDYTALSEAINNGTLQKCQVSQPLYVALLEKDGELFLWSNYELSNCDLTITYTCDGYVRLDKNYLPLGDAELNNESKHYVQNKAIKTYIDNSTADWNQCNETATSYIKNRTHYDAGIADFTPSGSWTLSSSVTGLPSGMATGYFAGEFEVESDKIVPISYDIGPMFGLNRTNVRIGEVIHNTTGAAFDFCVNATYTGGGQWKLFFYTSSGTLYGNAPTISNIKIGVQLDKKYLPMNDIISAVKNATGVLPVKSGGTGYSSITDTVYTAPRYRASSLHSSETTPTANGVICWTYE